MLFCYLLCCALLCCACMMSCVMLCFASVCFACMMTDSRTYLHTSLLGGSGLRAGRLPMIVKAESVSVSNSVNLAQRCLNLRDGQTNKRTHADRLPPTYRLSVCPVLSCPVLSRHVPYCPALVLSRTVMHPYCPVLSRTFAHSPDLSEYSLP